MKVLNRKNISDLETDKRELVGVFGQTGAGKSSLINAVIGEKELLPSSGRGCACTSVITKVESNMQKKHYEAEIEFTGKEVKSAIKNIYLHLTPIKAYVAEGIKKS